MAPPWKKAIDVINNEREYQSNLNPNVLSVGEEIALAQKYIGKALDAWSENFGPGERPALEELRKVAAICIRAMENHGAYRREWCLNDVAIRKEGK